MGRLCVVSGDDDFAIKAKARELAWELCGGDPETDPALEVIPGTGDELKFSEIADRMLAALRTPPFLSDHQVIWLRNFAFFDELSSALEAKSAAGEVARLLCSSLPPEQSILINGTGLDGRKSFSKKIKTAGAELFLLSAPRNTDRNFAENRRHRLQEACREAGKAIAPQAMQYLEEIVGGNSGTMAQELEKLFCYVGEAPEITLADCRAVCSRTPEAVSWAFTGALMERNVRNALEVLDTLMRQGDAELRVLASVASEFQQLLQTREAMRELGITRVNPRTFDQLPGEVRDKFPENHLLKLHPFRAYKMCERAMSFGDAELAGILKSVLEANRALVSGGGEPRMILEQLIFQIAGTR